MPRNPAQLPAGTSKSNQTDPGVLAKRLRECRERRGFTQRQLAGKLGVSPGAVGQWESGTARPSLVNLSEIAKEFQVRVEWLLGKASVSPEKEAESLRLVEEARRLGVDLNAVIAEARQRRWLEQNREALADANAFLERYGLWSDGRRLF